jgi:hypothetical protein
MTIAVPLGPNTELGLLRSSVTAAHLDHKLAALGDVKIRHVAGMVALRRHKPMLLAVRIEMAACGIERRFAFPDRMNMKGMLAGWQSLHR